MVQIYLWRQLISGFHPMLQESCNNLSSIKTIIIVDLKDSKLILITKGVSKIKKK